MFRKVRAAGLAFLALMIFAGCAAQNQLIVTVIPTIPTDPPTVELVAPLSTMTPRFTATLIPTSTTIPTNTLPATNTPVPVTLAPTIPPTAGIVIRGSIEAGSAAVNMRSGPGRDFNIVQRVNANTSFVVLGANAPEKEWLFVQLDSGITGWILSNLMIVSDIDNVPVLTEEQIARLEQAPPTVVPTDIAKPRPRRIVVTDVLAYCDNEGVDRNEKAKVLRSGSEVTVYWSWYAQTPEQIKDHTTYANYEVTLDGNPLENWRDFETAVGRVSPTRYEVWWLVPVGVLESGEHRIEYKVSWSQRIEDGEKSFGPGGDEETNSGSCVFTIQ